MFANRIYLAYINSMKRKRRTPHRDLLKKAATYARYGLTSNLAVYLDITVQALWHMHKNNKVHHRHWQAIQELTNGDIKESEWR